MTASFRAAIVTVSDRSKRGEREDLSGPALAEAVQAAGGLVVARHLVADDQAEIASTLSRLADKDRTPLVLTTGGTGFAPRDVTPEATRSVIQRDAPGLAEFARAATVSRTRFAILSRGVAGIRGATLIVNLPGSPKGACEMFDVLAPVLPHALSVLARGGDEHPRA